MERPRRQPHGCPEKERWMGLRIPNLGVFLTSLGVGVLAIYLGNVAVAAICLSIAAAYAAIILWQCRRRKRNG